MRFWWVNQNQTYRQETTGGYLWSPKVKADGGRNPFYDSMREVAPGDTIFSFSDTLLKSIGIARSFCFESPKPAEFGTAGPNWNQVGWRVQIEWSPLIVQVRPKDQMALIRPHLPAKYSPLRETGDGLQGIYLTELPSTLAGVLGSLIGPEFAAAVHRASIDDNADLELKDVPLLQEWEDHLQHEIEADDALPVTQRTALVQARRGQGLFKERVRKLETFCRVTHVDNPAHLIASHCKPWRDSRADERLDGENGLLLTPSIDHLFDRGFISFEDNGDLLISPVAHRLSLRRMGVATESGVNGGGFSEGQRHYLEFHRNSVFLERRSR
jgi:hypothetical protein